MTIIYPPDLQDGNLTNWERGDVRFNGTVDITTEQPFLGNGSAEFNLTNGTDKAGLVDLFPAGDTSHLLSNITEVSYDWFRDSSSTNNPVQHVSLKMYIDGDGNLATTQDRLTMAYEEAYNNYPGGVPTDQWVHSNATNGNWWVFHSPATGYPGATGMVEVYDRTIAEWISQTVTYNAWTDPIGPNSVVLGVALEAGSGWNGVSTNYADNVQVIFGNASDIIANFEVLPALPDCVPDDAGSKNLILGTPGPDSLNGTGGGDLIRGLDGNDRLDGRGGKDYVLGEGGNDTVSGGAGKDFVDGGAGKDTVYGGDGDDELHGDSCIDNGQGGKDVLYGGEGNDEIDGDGNDDRLFGGNGNDLLFGGGGADTLDGGNGNDRVAGDEGEDTVLGGAGNDSLFGGSGDDDLNGNAGFDFYTGNGGSDLFIFDIAGTSSAPERDAVTDFSFGATTRST